MSAVVGGVGQSHSPLWGIDPPKSHDDAGATFVAAVERSRALIRRAEPDVVVLFGPDHFRFSFYNLMPRFCIGTGVVSAIGDYATPSGVLPTRGDLAGYIYDSVCSRGFDPVYSLDMTVDHGLTQTYAALFPGLDMPLVPIMVNTSAPPLPSVRRCHEFGLAVGRAISEFTGELRVLIGGSGGISHWPPRLDPSDPALAPELREFLLTGRPGPAEFEPQREAGVRAMGRRGGRTNPDWDHRFLGRLTSGDIDTLLDLGEAEIDREAGNGAQEIRTWIAAFAAFTQATGLDLAEMPRDAGYESVPSWLTGMGTLTVLSEE